MVWLICPNCTSPKVVFESQSGGMLNTLKNSARNWDLIVLGESSVFDQRGIEVGETRAVQSGSVRARLPYVKDGAAVKAEVSKNAIDLPPACARAGEVCAAAGAVGPCASQCDRVGGRSIDCQWEPGSMGEYSAQVPALQHCRARPLRPLETFASGTYRQFQHITERQRLRYVHFRKGPLRLQVVPILHVRGCWL